MKHRVIIHMKAGGKAGKKAGLFKSVAPGREAAELDSAAAEVLKAVEMDLGYSVDVPHPGGGEEDAGRALFKSARAAPVEFGNGFLKRGLVDEEDLERIRQVSQDTDALDVYRDPPIAPAPLCGSSPPLGNAVNVANALGYPALQAAGMDGSGVMVAIVDTGFNLAYLNRMGLRPGFDPLLSWSFPGATPPGQGNLSGNDMQHGTMSAYDALIGAPRCTLLDYPVLSLPPDPQVPTIQGILSDAILAYGQLLRIRQRMPSRALVVNNSWAMYSPAWDWPIGTPGNYSDNPDHPFNLIVAALDRAGADILFAAGNCGNFCPDDKCQGITNVIYGAASSPSVLCVAGVDLSGAWVGYSTQGPGLLDAQKPDVAGFTQFQGSGVWLPQTLADSGTSAATPVVSGLIAAVRTKTPPTSTTPAQLRDLVRSTAYQPAGGPPFNFNLGWGIVNGPGLVARLTSAGAGGHVRELLSPPVG